MVYIVCPPLTMTTSTDMINNEIARLEGLMEQSQDMYETKQRMCKFFMFVSPSSGGAADQENVALITEHSKKHTKQFQATKAFTELKISFWKQFLTKKVRPTLLEELNEALTEWLEASWEYFGQEKIKEDSESAKEEYKMFKQMFEICEKLGVCEKKEKKKTRRGGKKHRK